MIAPTATTIFNRSNISSFYYYSCFVSVFVLIDSSTFSNKIQISEK